jgi:hypothetical protein
MVWTSLLEKPLEVVYGRPHWTPITTSGGRYVSHTGAAHHPVVAIVTAGRGCGPLKMLLLPLVAAFDALLGAVGGDIGWCLPVAALGGLPASLCWAKHDRLIGGGALGANVVWLLECAPEEVAMFALSQALCVTFR